MCVVVAASVFPGPVSADHGYSAAYSGTSDGETSGCLDFAAKYLETDGPGAPGQRWEFLLLVELERLVEAPDPSLACATHVPGVSRTPPADAAEVCDGFGSWETGFEGKCLSGADFFVEGTGHHHGCCGATQTDAHVVDVTYLLSNGALATFSGLVVISNAPGA